MKKLQIRLPKIIGTILIFFCIHPTFAQTQKIAEADSLFKGKQYTQSLEFYQAAFDGGSYSPAMLLKMAYIQEGLGKIGPTLYYLELYQRATGDEQALRKIEELAAKFKLTGYESDDASRIYQWVSKGLDFILLGLMVIVLLAAVAMAAQRRKNRKPWLAASVIVVVSCGILFLNNFYAASAVITKDNHTYLMEGPSAGARVATVVGEGNQLQLLGQEDVWLRVRWTDKTLYLKKSSALTIAL